MFHTEFVTGLTASGVWKLKKLLAFFLTDENLQTDSILLCLNTSKPTTSLQALLRGFVVVVAVIPVTSNKNLNPQI